MRKVVVIFLILFLLFAAPVYAQETMDSSPSSDIAASTSSYVSEIPSKTEYQLPYPGLLPDSPLYFVKVFRDRLIDFLVSDPLKKAELNLLQADKRLVAADMLFANGKPELGESTLSKGENYFSDGIAKLKEARKQGMDTGRLTDRFAMSLEKHQDVTNRLIGKSKGNVKTRLQDTKTRLANFEKQVNALRAK